MATAAGTAPTMTLNNGTKIPILGLGTWQGGNDPGTVEQAIKDAIDAGYRHFDCAYIYGNEKVIGKVMREKIAEGVVKREDLYITTKLWNTMHDKDDVVPACKESLKNFGFDYIDLYLIHWPVAYTKDTKGFWVVDEKYGDADYTETWKGMEECVKLGLTKSIGLSNFNSIQIDRILSVATIRPVINQVECHINLNQKKLREFCAARNIAITAYSPLGAPSRPWAKSDDPQVNINQTNDIAKKYGKTPAQVIFRFLVDIGTIPIPKSASKIRIKENINIFDFKLTPEEIAIIEKFDCGLRTCVVEEYRNHKDYPFSAEF